MADVRAKIELLLKDKLSPAVKGASANVKKFGNVASQVAHVSGRAFDSLGAKIGGLGLAFGALNVIKFNTEYEDALIRMGTNAGATAQETNELRRELLKTAKEAKIGVDGLVSFGNALAENSIGLNEIKAAAPLAAAAIQGLGMSGDEFAALYSVLENRGADLDSITEKLNNLAEIDDRLQGVGVSQFAKELPKLMEVSNAGIENIEDMYLAVLTLNNGASNTEAITQYEKAMQEFASPETRDAMRKYLKGFDPIDKSTGKLKSFDVIMGALAEKGNEIGSMDKLQKAFGVSDKTIQALKTYNNHYQNTIKKVGKLGDTEGAVSRRAEQNAQSVASNLKSIQTVLYEIGNDVFSKPLAELARLANEHPKGLELAIKGIGVAILALAGMKAFGTVFNFVSQLRSIKAPKIGSGLTGGGIPVHVTNAGAMGAGSLLDGTPISGKGGSGAKALTAARTAVGGLSVQQYAMGGATAGIGAAFVKIPQMMGELDAIEENADLSAKEKSKEKGGAIGDATGGIIGGVAGGIGGVAAGAAVGAAVGSVVPVLGTAVGALVGAGVGALGMWLGSKAGRAIGEGIGEAVAEDENEGYVPAMQGVPLNSMAYLAESGGVANQSIEPVVVGTEVVFKDDRTEVRTYNKTERGSFGNYQYATGYNPYARAMP